MFDANLSKRQTHYSSLAMVVEAKRDYMIMLNPDPKSKADLEHTQQRSSQSVPNQLGENAKNTWGV